MDTGKVKMENQGYQCYWRRISRKMGLSEAAKQLGDGVRASQLSAFERGQPHTLSQEQIDAYVALLFAEDEGGSLETSEFSAEE
jgi:hypothetical protein